MPKTFLIASLAALTLVASGSAAFAQQGPGRAMRADIDGDQRLSQAEFVGQRVQRLTTADVNRDGTVTADERRATMQGRRAARADARFDRLDADDNGAVSRAEFDAAREAGREARADRGDRPMRAGRGAGRGQRGMARMMARGEAGAPVVIADVQMRAEQMFARLDADHDGFITVAEGRAARQGMRENGRERGGGHRAVRQAPPRAPASE